jgi:hypothetical protein
VTFIVDLTMTKDSILYGEYRMATGNFKLLTAEQKKQFLTNALKSSTTTPKNKESSALMLLPDEIRRFILRNEGATEKRSNIDIKNELIAKYSEYIKKINDYYEFKKAINIQSSPPGSSPVPEPASPSSPASSPASPSADPSASPSADQTCKNSGGCTVSRHRTRKTRRNKRKTRRTRKTN